MPRTRKGYVFKKPGTDKWVGLVPGRMPYYGTWREMYDTVDNAMRSSNERSTTGA